MLLRVRRIIPYFILKISICFEILPFFPDSEISYLSELFIEGVGGELCRQRLAEVSHGVSSVWREDLSAFVNNLCQIMYPFIGCLLTDGRFGH